MVERRGAHLDLHPPSGDLRIELAAREPGQRVVGTLGGGVDTAHLVHSRRHDQRSVIVVLLIVIWVRTRIRSVSGATSQQERCSSAR